MCFLMLFLIRIGFRLQPVKSMAPVCLMCLDMRFEIDVGSELETFNALPLPNARQLWSEILGVLSPYYWTSSLACGLNFV